MNLEIASQEFEKYVEHFDKKNPNMSRKIDHSKRVMNISIKIAESLNMNSEEIKVAAIIGLLHDIGKIKQIDENKKEIEHGKYAVQILQKDNYIRCFIKENNYDKIIFSAIENHGLFKIKNNLSNEELKFTKIVRDADKLDIFYQGVNLFWNNEEDRNEIEDSTISNNVLEAFEKNILIAKEERWTPLDKLVGFISMIYDINFNYDFLVLKKEGYINKILDKFNFKNELNKIQIENIQKTANKYIQKRLE